MHRARDAGTCRPAVRYERSPDGPAGEGRIRWRWLDGRSRRVKSRYTAAAVAVPAIWLHRPPPPIEPARRTVRRPRPEARPRWSIAPCGRDQPRRRHATVPRLYPALSPSGASDAGPKLAPDARAAPPPHAGVRRRRRAFQGHLRSRCSTQPPVTSAGQERFLTARGADQSRFSVNAWEPLDEEYLRTGEDPRDLCPHTRVHVALREGTPLGSAPAIA